MSGIPDQDVTKETYTASEMAHLVAREVMKHRMGDLEQNLARSADNVDSMFGGQHCTCRDQAGDSNV